MALPEKPSMAVCADAVVAMLNDEDRAWSGEFTASRQYLPKWSEEQLRNLCCAVTYGTTNQRVQDRANRRKDNEILISFRKKLDQPDGDADAADPYRAEMDQLAAIVELVADFFGGDTTNGGLVEIGTTKAYVTSVETFPVYNTDEFNKKYFSSQVTLTVTGITQTVNENNP